MRCAGRGEPDAGGARWLPVAPYREGLSMAITINDDLMTLVIDGTVAAVGRRRCGGWWEVTNWPSFFDRHQTITALTVTELLETGRRSDDPLVLALREELLEHDDLGIMVDGVVIASVPEAS